MKPPKVSRKMWEGRQPLGLLKNGLPNLYVVVRDDGAVWLMEDRSTGESTGAQVCWGIIPAGVAQALREARLPQILVPEAPQTHSAPS